MYAVAITALIHKVKEEGVQQVWFGDDAMAGGKLAKLHAWWDHICELGPDYGYFPNATKTWLVVKGHLEGARGMFEGTGITITVEGRRYLGAAIGNHLNESHHVLPLKAWLLHFSERRKEV